MAVGGAALLEIFQVVRLGTPEGLRRNYLRYDRLGKSLLSIQLRNQGFRFLLG